MADEIEKARLQVQRDAALDVANAAVTEGTEAKIERDVVIGAAVNTARERDLFQAQRDRVAAERNVVQDQRDAAFQYAAVEQAEARGSAAGFYTLLVVAVLVLLVIAGVYLTRSPNAQPGTQTVVRSGQPVPGPDNPAPVVLQPGSAPATPAPVSATPLHSAAPAPVAPVSPPIVAAPTAATGTAAPTINTAPQNAVPPAPAPIPPAPSEGTTTTNPATSTDSGTNTAATPPPADGGASAGGGTTPAAPTVGGQ